MLKLNYFLLITLTLILNGCTTVKKKWEEPSFLKLDSDVTFCIKRFESDSQYFGKDDLIEILSMNGSTPSENCDSEKSIPMVFTIRNEQPKGAPVEDAIYWQNVFSGITLMTVPFQNKSIHDVRIRIGDHQLHSTYTCSEHFGWTLLPALPWFRSCAKQYKNWAEENIKQLLQQNISNQAP